MEGGTERGREREREGEDGGGSIPSILPGYEHWHPSTEQCFAEGPRHRSPSDLQRLLSSRGT